MSNNEDKKEKGFSQGIILIIIGVVFTLVTLFDFDVNWHIVAKMWPLLLIIIGVCIMPINRWIRLAITMGLLAFGVVTYLQKTDGYTKVIDKTEFKSKSHTTIVVDDDDDDF